MTSYQKCQCVSVVEVPVGDYCTNCENFDCWYTTNCKLGFDATEQTDIAGGDFIKPEACKRMLVLDREQY